ncbi:hypothetical protein LTR66_013240 [Elasticomyces elasticus]|nr:hypothetical protein LTR66_013240 [Elasticomyces elasticus]
MTSLSAHPVWLRDFLPEEGLHARIMAFNHNTAWQANAIAKSLQDHGEDLVRALRRVRKTPEEKCRPIAFIGHSFGGLIVKQALVVANGDAGDDVGRGIVQQTQGFIFLGVPHKGARLTFPGMMLSLFGH